MEMTDETRSVLGAYRRNHLAFCSLLRRAICKSAVYDSKDDRRQTRRTDSVSNKPTNRSYEGSLMEGARKDDQGKTNMSYLFEYFPDALKAIAEVSDFGATKYAYGGWKEVNGGLRRYESALGRHLLDQYLDGPYDKESGLLHKAHLAWNAVATLQLYIEKTKDA
ncbi:MAG: hypothetical protein H3Z50_07710 [archaeon]|nr:hypothetical protein [archaeon]